MPGFTQEQQKAIFTHDHNLIVVAGAGSGKTRVLVERYLTLLDANPDWPLNAVVAITFTREAAFEMRHRVRHELEGRLEAATSPEMVKRWTDCLAQMDSARIDTIHSLCASVLRANAAEAGVDPRFEILEPVDATLLLQDVIDLELERLANDPDDDTIQLFTEYDLHDVRDVLSNPELLSISFENIPDDPQRLFETWVDEWAQNYASTRERLFNDPQFATAIMWEPAQGWPDDDKLMSSFRALWRLRDDIKNDDVQESFDACEALIAAIDLRGGSAANWGDKETVNAAKSALRTVRTQLEVFLKTVGTMPADLDAHAAEMLLLWYRLIARIRDGYQAEKSAQGRLDFADLEAKAAILLSTNEQVRERYRGAEYKCLLVDEFQDTNAAQWQIVQALVNMDDAALFVVGDQKQSIYGFRGADVSAFDQVRQTVAELQNGAELPLSQSFRSHPGLIEAFNKLFAQILVRDENSPVAEYEIEFEHDMSAFRDVLPQRAQHHYAPIEVTLLANVQAHLDDKVSATERRVWEAWEIATRLQRLQSEEAPIFDKESNDYRPFNFGDTAILFQSTGSITVYEDVFKMLDIPFVTIAGRGYYDRQEVWDTLNVLRCLHNPSDELSLAAALRSPIFGFSDDMLLALRLAQRAAAADDAGFLLWDALALESIDPLSSEQMKQVHFAYQTLTALRQLAGRVTIAELLRQVLSRTGYLAMLTGLPGGVRLRRNIEKLIDIAEASGKVLLGEFSHYLDDLTAREVRESEAMLDVAGSVQLMTVHASKGLEFPVVVLADAGWTRGSRDTSPVIYDTFRKCLACRVYDDEQGKLVASYAYHQAQHLQNLREEAERKRLLYVAATRARDCLMISGEIRFSKNRWSTKGWLDTLLAPLEISEIDALSDGDERRYTPNSLIHISLPHYDPDLPRKLLVATRLPAWEPVAGQRAVEIPEGLRKIAIRPEQKLGHIAATQLAHFGSYHYSDQPADRAYYRESIQRYVFSQGKTIIETVENRTTHVSQMKVGEIVHEALRHWRFPDNTPELDDLLRTTAWQHQITVPHRVEEAISRAHNLLERFQSSDIFQRMNVIREKGLPFYSELPFIYRTDQRIIHGIIDMLFQDEAGNWVLVDYKTSTIKPYSPGQLAGHARRYYLQVGAYASAVQQELGGQIPDVFIHYIQYNQAIQVPTEVWQSEIKQLEAYIGELIYDA